MTDHPDVTWSSDPTGQRTWNVPVPGSYWKQACVTSMLHGEDPIVQLSGAAQFTPDQAQQVGEALLSAAADARLRFAQNAGVDQ